MAASWRCRSAMSSAPDPRHRASRRGLVAVVAGAGALADAACWPLAADAAGRAQPEGSLVICHERRVEMIVGGLAERDAHPCAGSGIDAERASVRPHLADARIAPATQRARDDDRRTILQQELDRAEGELAQERSRPAGDPRALARKQEDVAALRRELQATPAIVR